MRAQPIAVLEHRPTYPRPEIRANPGFTRLADRLKRRGLIERRRSVDDGRGYVAILTRDGRALLRKAWRQQSRDLRTLFFDRLDDEQLRSLVDL